MFETQVMPRDTQDRTAIAIIRDHVEDWRRDNRWSRETLVQHIVEAHAANGYDKLTGIRFEPPTTDAYERMRVNADKVYRWLDDATKDKNLLATNMLWSILAALPEDRRASLASALLAPVGLSVLAIGLDLSGGDDQAVIVQHFTSVLESTASAQVAMGKMLDGIDPGEPEVAHDRLGKALTSLKAAFSFIGRLRRRKS